MTDHLDDFNRYASCGLGMLLRRDTIARVGLLDGSFKFTDTDYQSRLVMAGINYRYLNVKLYEAMVFPHSGMAMAKDLMGPDYVRAYLRTRAWTHCFDWSWKHFAQVTGLIQVPGGDLLGEMIWHLERLRRRRIGYWLFWLISWATLLSLRLISRVWKSKDSVTWHLAGHAQSSLRDVPGSGAHVWDGALQ